MLQNKLAEWGYTNKDGSAIDLFNPEKNAFKFKEAEANRDSFLCDANGERLKQTDYPGTILETTPCTKTGNF